MSARVLLLVGATGAAANTPAEETVVLRTGVTLHGEVLRYDDEGVELRLDAGRTIRYRPDAIVEVRIARLPEHRQGLEALRRRDWSRATERLSAALSRESREWAAARIEQRLVEALRGQGEWIDAATVFLDLHGRRPGLSTLASAPLMWRPDQTLPEPMRIEASGWLASPDPRRRLLASSWLLSTPLRDRAITRLDRLRADNAELSWLARAQLWRLWAVEGFPPERSDASLLEPAADPDAEGLRRFEALVEKMAPPLRPGPRFVLAVAYEERKRPADASLAYLRVAFDDASPGDLGPAALEGAARCADRAGMPADAARLRQILRRDDPWAPADPATDPSPSEASP